MLRRTRGKTAPIVNKFLSAVLLSVALTLQSFGWLPPVEVQAAQALMFNRPSLSIEGGETQIAVTNAPGYTNLNVTFHHGAGNLESNDTVVYGWRAGEGGADNQLGVLQGATGNPGVGENGEKSLTLPDSAGISNLVFYFRNTGTANDQVNISSLAITGVEPAPPVVNYSLNLSVGSFHNRNGDSHQDAGEENLAGWTVRLYKETEAGWELKDTKQTALGGRVSFAGQKTAGTYHVCEVSQLGWTQTRQDWSGTPYHVATDNQSPNKAEEGSYCNTTSFANTASRSTAVYIGNRYNDQTDQNQLNLSGIVFDNRNGNSSRESGESILPNWTLRLYKEDLSGNWQRLAETATRSSDNKYVFTQKEAGIYHVCLVGQAGWGQVRQDWNGTPYHIVTANQSGASDEGGFCTVAVYDDSADSSTAKYFGVRDNQPPVLTTANPTENQILNTRVTGQKLKIDGTFTDNVRPNYAHIQLVDADGNSRGLTTVYGNESGTYAAELSTVGLSDGVYRLYVWGTDFTGNVSDRSSSVRTFQLDNTRSVDQLISPINNSTNPAQMVVRSSDAVGLQYVTANIYNQTNTTLIKSCSVQAGGRTESVAICAVPEDLPDGIYTIRYNSRDLAGNTSATKTSQFVIDRTAPMAPSGLQWQDSVGNVVTITNDQSGSASWQASSSEDVISYIYRYWNDIEGNQYKENTPWETILSGTVQPGVFNQGEGIHHFCVIAVDRAGNQSACSQAMSITYDKSYVDSTNNQSGGDGASGTNEPGEFANFREPPETPEMGAGSPTGFVSAPVIFTTLFGVTGNVGQLSNFGLAADDTTDATPSPAANESGNVLGDRDSSYNGDSEGDVLGDSQVAEGGCSKLLGLCWYWWIPIGVVVTGVVWLAVATRRREDYTRA